MNLLEEQLENTKLRLIDAQKKGDLVMCRLWERVGNSIKARIAERLGLQTKQQEIENIFGGKLL